MVKKLLGRSLCVVMFICCCVAVGTAQTEVELAKQYFRQGEFEKAAQLYDELYRENPRNTYYLDQHILSLSEAQLYDEADAALRRAIDKFPKRLELLVRRGLNFEAQDQPEKAEKLYREALERMPGDRFSIQRIAGAFTQANKYAYAAEAYERGGKLLQNDHVFAYSLASIYRQLNDQDNMVRNYIQALADNPRRMGNIQKILARTLDEEGYRLLQRNILRELQGNPENDFATELLIWSYIQQGDYRSAMRQVKALDLRRDEDGGRIFNLATTARNERRYEVAIQGFEYIVENKEPGSPYYSIAQKAARTTERKMLEEAPVFDRSGFVALERKYEQFLDSLPLNASTAYILHDLAMLRAERLDKRQAAIADLKALLEVGLPQSYLARVKLDLADLYLMEGDRWEAALLYGQVDKAFPEAQVGNEARFRNARLAYYFGDFEWAQEQFDILKQSTTRLIANDAIDMAVFIMDNLNLDTSTVPMERYAQAELLGFQSKYNEALAELDFIEQAFPDSDLADDIDFERAKLYAEQGNFEQAAMFYQRVVDNFPESIRADNALFRLAGLYEHQLRQPDRAKNLYERLFLEYESSVLAVEARKAFRRLRGDEVG